MKTKLIFAFLILLCSICKSQTTDEKFNSFFAEFKKSIKNQEIETIISMTNFPFYCTETNQNTTRTISSDEFKSQPILPEYSILSKVKLNKTIKKGNKTINFTYENDLYKISCTEYFKESGLDATTNYYFGKVNDEFKYIKNEWQAE